MNWFMDAQNTWMLLMVTQAAHLFHHRLAKRHISFVEVITGILLCLHPASFPGISPWMPAAHLVLVAIQIAGSLFINRLSPDWDRRPRFQGTVEE